MGNQVSLYQCLYGMELFKHSFASEKALDQCLLNVIRFYSGAHSNGKIVGPLQFDKIVFDLDTGEISEVATIGLDEAAVCVETMKFLPPEVIRGGKEFGMEQDRYSLAVLLFAIRYFANPFDGSKTEFFPVVTTESAQQKYGSPVFVFDSEDRSNLIYTQTDPNLVDAWENEPYSKIKDLFSACFTAGRMDPGARPDVKAWSEAFGIPSEVEQQSLVRNLILEWEGKTIQLREGLEIFESDLYEEGQKDKKIAVVIKSSKEDDILSLRNESDDTWSVYLSDSREIMVAPQNVTQLNEGATISIDDLLLNIKSEEEQ